jgi:citrate lyase subunit beta/citryl-CoA lyase
VKALRSLLFAPASRPDLVEKALGRGADAVIVDLEDSVPVAEKEAARANVALAREAGCPVYVRVNGPGTEWIRDDLAVAAAAEATGVMIPKVETVDEVAAIDAELAPPLELVLLIESALGVLNAHALAKASPRVASLCCASGEAGDLAADLGTRDASGLLYARSQVLLAARAAGIAFPLDGVFMAIHDLDGLRADAELARNLGYTGKALIHPAQIPVVHEVFTPSDEEVARQRRFVEAFDEAVAAGSASITVDGTMVDYAVAHRARQILELAEAVR